MAFSPQYNYTCHRMLSDNNTKWEHRQCFVRLMSEFSLTGYSDCIAQLRSSYCFLSCLPLLRDGCSAASSMLLSGRDLSSLMIENWAAFCCCVRPSCIRVNAVKGHHHCHVTTCLQSACVSWQTPSFSPHRQQVELIKCTHSELHCTRSILTWLMCLCPMRFMCPDLS